MPCNQCGAAVISSVLQAYPCVVGFKLGLCGEASNSLLWQ